MKGLIDRSNAADEARRNERIALIEEWDKFQSGEEFTAREAADRICRCTSDNAPMGNCGCPSRVRDILDKYMHNVGRRNTSKCALYSKRPTNWLTRAWR